MGKSEYVSPQVEIIDVEMEKGFAEVANITE